MLCREFAKTRRTGLGYGVGFLFELLDNFSGDLVRRNRLDHRVKRLAPRHESEAARILANQWFELTAAIDTRMARWEGGRQDDRHLHLILIHRAQRLESCAAHILPSGA